MPRNPKWNRDELILALHLYKQINPALISSKNPDIIALSNLLNSLPIHARSNRDVKFRNANGVSMKLSNFLRFDPNYDGVGLQRGAKLEDEVWNEFADEPQRLEATASAIQAVAPLVSPPADDIDFDIEQEDEFPEGRVLTLSHKRRERNPKASKEKKRSVMERMGVLECEVCSFDFQVAYGDIGYGFAECHHRIPLSELTSSRITRLEDLSIVCANCHRMLHRIRPWKTIEELRNIIKR